LRPDLLYSNPTIRKPVTLQLQYSARERAIPTHMGRSGPTHVDRLAASGDFRPRGAPGDFRQNNAKHVL
jgi:hypothetical protein